MKKWMIVLLTLVLLLAGCLLILQRAFDRALQRVTEAQFPPTATVRTEPAETTQPETQPPTTVPPETEPPVVLTFTAEEEDLLLKLAMAERGDTGCETCMALVMRTVLNRVDAPKFGSSIRSVIYAQDQFTPVMDGTFEAAEPDEACLNALDMVKRGWDESRGALYYEWCEGESWHSKNLSLLMQHCDTRFYQ